MISMFSKSKGDESQMCKHGCVAVFSGDYSRIIWLSGLVILAHTPYDWLICHISICYVFGYKSYENRAIYSQASHYEF